MPRQLEKLIARVEPIRMGVWNLLDDFRLHMENEIILRYFNVICPSLSSYENRFIPSLSQDFLGEVYFSEAITGFQTLEGVHGCLPFVKQRDCRDRTGLLGVQMRSAVPDRRRSWRNKWWNLQVSRICSKGYLHHECYRCATLPVP